MGSWSASPKYDPKPKNETVGKLKAARWMCSSGRGKRRKHAEEGTRRRGLAIEAGLLQRFIVTLNPKDFPSSSESHRCVHQGAAATLATAWLGVQKCGSACIESPRGTRIPVELIADMLSQGAKPEEILEGYPALDREMVELAPLYVQAFPRRGRAVSRPWAKRKPIRAPLSVSTTPISRAVGQGRSECDQSPQFEMLSLRPQDRIHLRP